jgi:hypothetical protein
MLNVLRSKKFKWNEDLMNGKCVFFQLIAFFKMMIKKEVSKEILENDDAKCLKDCLAILCINICLLYACALRAERDHHSV